MIINFFKKENIKEAKSENFEEEDFILNFKPFEESLNEDISKLKNDLISVKLEIDELEKQINDIQRNKYRDRENRVHSYPEYQKAEEDLYDLEDQIRSLESQYGEWKSRVWFVNNGTDEPDKESESWLEIKDAEKQKELEPKVKELQKQCDELHNLISNLYKRAEQELKAEQDLEGKQLNLKAKKELHDSTIKQFLEEEKESLQKVIEELSKIGLKHFKLSERVWIKDGYVDAKLEKNERIEIDDYSEWFDDDEDHYFEEGHLEDITYDKAAELMEYLDDSSWEVVEKDSITTWVAIPNTDWECSLTIDPDWDQDKLPKITTYKYYPATWGYYGGSPEEWDIEWDPDFVDVSYIIWLRKKID